MRYAFKTAPQNTNWDAMLDVWRAADDIELFESGWLFDHFYPVFSDPTGPCLEGWVTLTALAQATKRLRLGTLVTGIHYRHPAVLAGIDFLLARQEEDGRWHETEFTGTGFPRVFYLRYHYYPIYFPLMALARWAGKAVFPNP